MFWRGWLATLLSGASCAIAVVARGAPGTDMVSDQAPGSGGDGTGGWLAVARDQTRAGAYEPALDAYRRQFTQGETSPTLICDSAALLMALGRLDEAIEQYREAVIILERTGDRDRRDDLRPLALGYLGLAVALDRAGHPVAAREALGRALAIDGSTRVLDEAAEPDGAVVLVPRGEVFYYLGLVREAQGRGDEAAAAFRSYLDLVAAKASGGAGKDPGPPARYLRAGRDHLSRLVSASAARASNRASNSSAGARAAADTTTRRGLRVLHEATVDAAGPLPAPLIDAAWRLRPRLLDRCLSDEALGPPGAPKQEDGTQPSHLDPTARARSPLELRLKVRFQADGSVGAIRAVSAAITAVEPPPALLTCIEDEVRAGLRTSRPAHPAPTRAEIDVVLAPVEPGG